jgi:hypothetical protein
MDPFNIHYFGGISSRSNLNWYTLSKVKPKASLVRFLLSVKTLIDYPKEFPSTPLVFPLRPRVQYLSRCIIAAFWMISC